MEEDGLLTRLAETEKTREAEEEERRIGHRLWEENKKLWRVVGPSILTRFSTFGVTFISQAFVGHLGADVLAAYALSSILIRLFKGILLGMASALETLCGQAYGANQHLMLGTYLQRSWIIMSVCCVLILPLFIFTSPLLKLLGQEESISEAAGTISQWFIPVMFSYVWAFTLQMYLQSQGKNSMVVCVAVSTLALHFGLCWFTRTMFGLGIAGVMISMIVSMWVPVLFQLGYLFLCGLPETWQGFSLGAFEDLGSTFKLSLSSGVMLCLELWYDNILLLLTGFMKNAKIAIDALSICININGWTMMISIGFLGAAGVRVANELGAEKAKRAKFAIVNTTVTSFIIGFALVVLFMALQGQLTCLLTENQEVASAVRDLFPLLAIYILLNTIQSVLSGAAVGAGRQGKVALVNLASYYLIGIPLGAFLGFVLGFHVKGIWVGMILGSVVQTLVLLYITIKTDWGSR
ncbi:hypothetical protein HPP92_022572 [Vanilla planifolia]|uniref:Protein DETOXIFICATION n=1 Tax=Vanilla planifolia TaxID=51239 RepID=A0A835UDY4_VANPL|nr:hypothetical protein HPP92_022572 [Vanilla planifolia]